MQILAYQIALEALRLTVSQRRWGDLAVKTENLNLAKQALENYLTHCDMDDELRQRLEDLSMKHRRVMRQLSEQMHHTEDDINSVNEGLRNLSRARQYEG